MYWRIMIVDGDVFPWAVGTVHRFPKGRMFYAPPTDGYPYLTDEQLGPALERARREHSKPPEAP